MRLETFEIILGFVGVFFVGVAFLAVFAKTSGLTGKKIDHRKEFFKLVEAAREAEILEKKPVNYDLSGTWKGEGDGYFGMGRNLTIEMEQNLSELSGRIIDNFGYSQIRGFFVWPYLWFDLERHGTIFEFRGILKEIPDGATITGKYRYFQDDAEWTVTRLGISPRAIPPGITESQSLIFAAVPKPDEDDENSATGTGPKEVPKEDDSGKKKIHDKPKKCPDCKNDWEPVLSFCIYCGKKDE